MFLKGRRAVVLALLAILAQAPLATQAQVPQTISYQGSLTDSAGVPVSGAFTVTFTLYDAAVGGTTLWTETQASVPVANGAFGVVFGADGGNPLDAAVFAGQVYLGVSVGGDAEMTPRQALTAVGYAIQAKNAETLGGLQSSEIVDAASDEVRMPIAALPFSISSSGSYFVTGDLTSAGAGIVVNADNVTIDLMGFSLNGPGSGNNHGVNMNGNNNIKLQNGTIRNFGLIGVTSNTGSNHVQVIGVHVADNLNRGISLINGAGHQVIDSVVVDNAAGVFVGDGALIVGNTIANNGSDGVNAGAGATVTGNTVRGNADIGILAGIGSVVTGNLTDGNLRGISVLAGSVVENNTASNSTEFGIAANQGSTITGNSVYSNGGAGIQVLVGVTVRGNTAYLNQNEGIALSGNSFVDGNTAYINNQSGGGFANISACGTCTFGNNHAP
jgi:hypothetical protein